MRTAGIDGCMAGWLLITLDKDQAEYRMLRKQEELESVFDEFDRIFIDIPIGLSDSEYTRRCDRELQKRLGSSNSNNVVVSPPIRPALHAPTYVEANMQSYEYTGEKLPLAAWNITPKIRIIDQQLQSDPALREKVLSSHPELLFLNLNGGMIYQMKQTKKGLKHRLDLVVQHEPKAADFFREIKEKFRRNEVEETVIVDSLALALGARESVARNRLRTLPDGGEVDSHGLPQVIHFV